MKKGYVVLIGILALVFSVLSVCVGYPLVWNSDLFFLQKCGSYFVFTMQLAALLWFLIACMKKKKPE